jgi:hypothetical protein
VQIEPLQSCKRDRVWCSLELIAEVHFEVHCVLNLGSLGVVEVVPWIDFGHLFSTSRPIYSFSALMSAVAVEE